ncbi:hypothetical protein E2C01_062853 [Portunus trituberculatus]|uniref:Uncharacterized protein n=1 Tax=Portunus trituberculatus TaxID=210409 RepID=A0A5B7H907_PORTR|nr:hypothetical protein [Portunus trituberculatus]
MDKGGRTEMVRHSASVCVRVRFLGCVGACYRNTLGLASVNCYLECTALSSDRSQCRKGTHSASRFTNAKT